MADIWDLHRPKLSHHSSFEVLMFETEPEPRRLWSFEACCTGPLIHCETTGYHSQVSHFHFPLVRWQDVASLRCTTHKTSRLWQYPGSTPHWWSVVYGVSRFGFLSPVLFYLMWRLHCRLWGITCVQTFTFFNRKSRDRPLFKLLVCVFNIFLKSWLFSSWWP